MVYFPLYKKLEGKELVEYQMEAVKPNPNFVFNNKWTQISKVKMRGASK